MFSSLVVGVPEMCHDVMALLNILSGLKYHLVGVFIAILVSSIVLPSILISAFAPLDRNSLIMKELRVTILSLTGLTHRSLLLSSLSWSHFRDLS